jgi:UDP-N-acetylmuramoyl-L-alanyl-D-glutamate--2,6-diaminopimelate ligase
MMKLKKLLKDIPDLQIKGPKEIEISGICSHSKLVSPGNLFIAKKGRTVEGVKYIPEAIQGGAAAILTDMYDPSIKGVTQVIHHDIASIEGLVAAQFNQFPSDQLFMVAITGTNGKTTTSYMIRHLLERYRGPCGLIGTIEYLIGSHSYQATHTTPDVSRNHRLLREIVNEECESAVMEVTSHGLDQGRVQYIDFDVAIFTNLTPEHLDYHKTMENYGKAKNILFRTLSKENKKKKFPKAAIINTDDPYAALVSEGCQADIMTYGIDKPADLQATNIQFAQSGTTFILNYQGQQYPCQVPIVGRYNVYNTLATIGCGLTQGFSLEGIIETLKTFDAVPGRLEAVPNNLGLNVYVDFAHTPDALDNVLKCLKEFKKGKIITVFGCGGDRDAIKRPKMAEMVEKFSDLAVVTSDNPRSENPKTIIEQIVQGFKKSDSYIIEVDRREAISKAIEFATKEDIVLIAGRGHEPYQTFAFHTIEFDDRKVAAEICKQLHQVGSK